MKDLAPINTLPAPGQPFDGGFLAGLLRGDSPDHPIAIIIAPKARGETNGVWHPEYPEVPGAMSFHDGAANTRAMAEAGSPIAQWALNLNIGELADWYIPARDELELCYRTFKPTAKENSCWRGDNPSSQPPGYAYRRDTPPQCALAEFQQGGAEAFDPEWYWSSTQYAGDSDGAWAQDFGNGNQNDNHKSFKLRVRAVRRLVL